MAALRVAAGRIGDIAAVACGGLADAAGAIAGASGLAQPAVAGTERFFSQPAGVVSLFALRRLLRLAGIAPARHECLAVPVAGETSGRGPLLATWQDLQQVLLVP